MSRPAELARNVALVLFAVAAFLLIVIAMAIISMFVVQAMSPDSRADEPMCLTPEPKDVACVLAFDEASDSDGRVVRYEIKEDGLPDGLLCATRSEVERSKKVEGKDPIVAPWPRFNPYATTGRCFPASGESRSYRVRACDDRLACGNWSAPYVVVGVSSRCCADGDSDPTCPGSCLRCCRGASCGPCSPDGSVP